MSVTDVRLREDLRTVGLVTLNHLRAVAVSPGREGARRSRTARCRGS